MLDAVVLLPDAKNGRRVLVRSVIIAVFLYTLYVHSTIQCTRVLYDNTLKHKYLYKYNSVYVLVYRTILEYAGLSYT
jgi:hypothetical protein